jgi:photosystem II stability/assembly factor-like uncharacterized protein
MSVAPASDQGDLDAAPADRSPRDIVPIEWSEHSPLAQHSLLLDAVALGGRIIAVGERGHVLLSDDGGEVWTQARVPTRRLLTAVASIGSEQLWAVGHDATIIRSQDGGDTWSRQFCAPELGAPLLDVWVGADGRGLAVGAYGLCLQTADAGQTWQRKSLTDDDPHLYAIAESPGGILLIAGEFGILLRSADRGRTWTRLPSPYEGTFFGALALGDELLLVFGLRGNCFRSEDGGQTWQRVATHSGLSLLGGLRRGDGTVLLAGVGGTLLVSTDKGHTFATTPSGTRGSLSAAVTTSPGCILLLGEGGTRSVDDSFLGLGGHIP